MTVPNLMTAGLDRARKMLYYFGRSDHLTSMLSRQLSPSSLKSIPAAFVYPKQQSHGKGAVN
jgi:hypothetical protein